MDCSILVCNKDFTIITYYYLILSALFSKFIYVIHYKCCVVSVFFSNLIGTENKDRFHVYYATEGQKKAFDRIEKPPFLMSVNNKRLKRYWGKNCRKNAIYLSEWSKKLFFNPRGLEALSIDQSINFVCFVCRNGAAVCNEHWYGTYCKTVYVLDWF